MATLDRTDLLRQIEQLRRSSLAPPAPAAEAEPVPPAWTARAAALASRERERVRGALEQPLTPELIAPALQLLADDELAVVVAPALEAAAPRCTGQLLDALLDRDRPVALRRRLPHVLEVAGGERVQRGLLAALGDDAFAVRLRAAQALARVVERDGGSVLAESDVWTAVRRELDRSEAGESAQPAASDPPPAPAPSATTPAPRVIELLFALLGVCLEREAVALSLQAILAGDARLRGTALEYLDNVLPADVRERLWPLLRAARTDRPKRARQAIVQELLTSSAELRLRR